GHDLRLHDFSPGRLTAHSGCPGRRVVGVAAVGRVRLRWLDDAGHGRPVSLSPAALVAIALRSPCANSADMSEMPVAGSAADTGSLAMIVKVLGSPVGGGLPQANCNCRNCADVRAGRPGLSPRTQSSLA